MSDDQLSFIKDVFDKTTCNDCPYSTACDTISEESTYFTSLCDIITKRDQSKEEKEKSLKLWQELQLDKN